ncbi:MAG: hypothetical protein ACTHMA_16515 [Thermomicrobiales bacterium]
MTIPTFSDDVVSELAPTRFVIQYRCGYHEGTALIVEDEHGAAYLFSSGALQTRLAGERAAERLLELTSNEGHWLPVPQVPPYTLDELCDLIGHMPEYGTFDLEARSAIESAAG